MSIHTLEHLEMHIVHDCNLKCKYCSHFCDYGYTGEIPFKQGSDWIQAWSKRLSPKIFRILGGEPLLHKDAGKYISLSAECFPNSIIDFVTNGLLLCKRKDILPVLLETKARLTISLHSLASKEQEAILNEALILAYGYQKKGLSLHIDRSQRHWRKLYQGEGLNITPFSDREPAESSKVCGNFLCKTLHQGKLWKCPPLAYIPLIVDQLTTKYLWEPYLEYKPLAIDSSDKEIINFLKGDTHFCDMCPAHKHIVPTEGFIPLIGELIAENNNYHIMVQKLRKENDCLHNNKVSIKSNIVLRYKNALKNLFIAIRSFRDKE